MDLASIPCGFSADGAAIQKHGVLLATANDPETAAHIAERLNAADDMGMMLRRLARKLPAGETLTDQVNDFIRRKCPGSILR